MQSLPCPLPPVDRSPLYLSDFSILVVKKPLFCPRPSCPHHHRPKGRWYSRFGRYHTRAHGWVNRFICNVCNKTCSEQTFHFTYYAKTRYPYPAFIYALSSTSGLRALGRCFGNRSPGSVANHIGRLARQAMAMKARMHHRFTLNENLCADGLVNFSVSQYFPTQTHILVGCHSQMLYFKDIITTRRSGAMSDEQKLIRDHMDALFPFDPHGVEKASLRFIKAALTLFATSAHTQKVLITDQKYEYRKVFTRIVDPTLRISHLAVSSKLPRTHYNPLFPVNYFDREVRKDIHDCVRETVCFPRNLNRHMQRLSVYEFWHNYLKPFRVGTEDRRAHAVVAGMEREKAQRELIRSLSIRACITRERIEQFDRKVWLEKLITPLAPEKKTRALARYIRS